MTKRLHHLKLSLHLAFAKSVQAYLDENNGDASAALTAAQRDITQREGQNSGARAFQRAYTKLVETLKLNAAPDDAEAASDAALVAVRALSETGASATQITAALKKLDLDPAKLVEQVTELRSQAANGARATELERGIAFRDAADALGYDAGRLTKVLRDEAGLPEKRALKTTVDGKEVTTDTWGIPSRDAAGKETGFTSLKDHAEVRGFEAALKRAPESGQPQQQSQQPQFQPQQFGLPVQRAGNPPAPAGATPLDQNQVRQDIAARGAGSI